MTHVPPISDPATRPRIDAPTHATPPASESSRGIIAIVPWAYARRLLPGHAVARADALTPAHRVACRFHALESARPSPWPRRADPTNTPTPMRLFTASDAVLLGLDPGEGLSDQRVSQIEHTGQLAPGDRVFWLELLWDPTGPADEPGTRARFKEPLRTPRTSAAPGLESPASVTPVPAAGAPTEPAPLVPPEYDTLTPPRRSEPEALKLLALLQLEHANPRGGVRGWWERRSSARRVARWVRGLAGKTTPEQLWNSRPPPTALFDPSVRGWVVRGLRAAGHTGAEDQVDRWAMYWLCRV